MYTIIANDMGKAAALGTKGAGVNAYYCGLHVGRGALPELLKLRAAEAQCKQSLARAERQRREQETPLRRELEAEKRLVRGLETELGLKKKQIRELEAGAGAGQKRIRELEAGGAGDEWTRMCDDKTVWPVLYKFIVARGFHPNNSANAGNADQDKFDAFFKMAQDKNDAFNGKGPESAAARTAREEHELGVDEDEVY
jgi:hypothetical protein